MESNFAGWLAAGERAGRRNRRRCCDRVSAHAFVFYVATAPPWLAGYAEVGRRGEKQHITPVPACGGIQAAIRGGRRRSAAGPGRATRRDAVLLHPSGAQSGQAVRLVHALPGAELLLGEPMAPARLLDG
jgi:hypothetical protein